MRYPTNDRPNETHAMIKIRIVQLLFAGIVGLICTSTPGHAYDPAQGARESDHSGRAGRREAPDPDARTAFSRQPGRVSQPHRRKAEAQDSRSLRGRLPSSDRDRRTQLLKPIRHASSFSRTTFVMPREGGASSTPRLLGSITGVSGILDRPPSRTMTTERVFAISRHGFARAFPISLPLFKTEGAGNAGCALHPRSRVPRIAHLAHTSIQVKRKHSDIPCAMAVTAYFVLSPVERACCHRRP